MERNSKIFLFIAIALFCITFAFAAGRDRSFDEKSFAKQAASGGIMEVALGQVALGRAENDAVEVFARRMIDDHSRANHQLMRMSAAEGLGITRDMDREEHELITRLTTLEGEKFDREYMKNMIVAHEEDIRMFGKMASEGKDPQLKSYAQNLLPVLNEHLRLAKEAYGKIGRG